MTKSLERISPDYDKSMASTDAITNFFSEKRIPARLKTTFRQWLATVNHSPNYVEALKQLRNEIYNFNTYQKKYSENSRQSITSLFRFLVLFVALEHGENFENLLRNVERTPNFAQNQRK